MPDEEEMEPQIADEAEVEAEPEAEPEEDVAPENESDLRVREWKGRLQKTQREFKERQTEFARQQDRMKAVESQLAASGFEVDPDTGAIRQAGPAAYGPTAPYYPPNPTTAYTPPQAPVAPVAPAEDEEDEYSQLANAPRPFIQREATSVVGQAMSAITPAMDFILDRTLKQEYPDWNDIRDEVTQTLGRWGFVGLTHAIQQPQVVHDAVLRARGRRAEPDKAEAARQDRLSTAAATGGPAGTSVSGPARYTPQQMAEMRAAGFTDKDLEALEGPVTIDVTGKTSETKKGGR